MTYTINKSDGTLLLNLADQTADTSASPLTLVGRGLLNYGRYEMENLIHLLENFANSAAPAHPMTGQFWYDKGTGKMKVWNGTVWLRSLLGTDDANVIPGTTFGAGLTLTSGTLTANVRSVATRTGDVTLGVSDVAGAAPLASPALSGTPTAPTPTAGDTTTKIATTAWVRNQILSDTLNYGAGNGLQVSGSNLAVLGTTNRITSSVSGVDIASTYAGQNSISTLGNITSGQWSATPIPLAYGGTGGTDASTARANLGVLQYGALAASLASVNNGIIVNNSGTAVARAVVSGSPDTISVTNGDGIGGNITVSLIGSNSGPVQITGGGTGATTKIAGFNALSPATTQGDLIFYNSGGHDRLAGKTDAPTYYLTSGANSAIPRWTTGIDSATLGGQNLSYVLNRANHTGTIDANRLGGQLPAYYLDYANFTGSLPSNAVISSSSDLSSLGTEGSGYVRFNGGLTFQWGGVSGYFSTETWFQHTFPIAFTTVFSMNVTNKSSSITTIYDDWWWMIPSGALTATGTPLQLNRSKGDTTAYSPGYLWFAVGYIA